MPDLDLRPLRLVKDAPAVEDATARSGAREDASDDARMLGCLVDSKDAAFAAALFTFAASSNTLLAEEFLKPAPSFSTSGRTNHTILKVGPPFRRQKAARVSITPPCCLEDRPTSGVKKFQTPHQNVGRPFLRHFEHLSAFLLIGHGPRTRFPIRSASLFNSYTSRGLTAMYVARKHASRGATRASHRSSASCKQAAGGDADTPDSRTLGAALLHPLQ
ncbi:hypothetical protein CC78DRAFT_622260 [Lojkania enalia]|uniref:Uncharacterized protein n=1 Tax=Lojkania enalia TaxID=147567 RepID=A0A9P4JVT4_9PLEO|nr:hypothetical protein CC78DRAFT_622260 [Didymosphaeria enalia]